MLFNSFDFLFVFLPIALICHYGVGRHSKSWAAALLALCSFAFYALSDAKSLPLLVASIISNFALGHWIAAASGSMRRFALVVAIIGNLLLLGWFKYVAFAASALASVGLFSGIPPAPELPVGISFFTFTQIAFLVDTYQGKVKHSNPIHYALFVTYFPHLVAGPILHHAQMIPQFESDDTYRVDWRRIDLGVTLFVIGMAKKLLLADELSVFVGPVFDVPVAPNLIDAWAAALAYTFQLYFDFSGYSDMAVGLGLIFGVRLPFNFDSPYQSVSIIDFWRRWHITLSTFLRDYLYVPLGGNKKGALTRYRNLMITMVLGGLWHGAGWTFLVWGCLHGSYLLVNHAWRAVQSRWWPAQAGDGPLARWVFWALTFLAVVVGWVFFRADSIDRAWMVLGGMAGLHGVVLPIGLLSALPVDLAQRYGGTLALSWPAQPVLVAVAAWVALFLPNAQALAGLVADRADGAGGRVRRAALAAFQHDTWRLVIVVGLALPCCLLINRVREFLYFQF
ncbi:MBOAT family O-acyltransferase [Roseateles sp. LYH14W]|uniref:Probable alginate O-acetylase AlgI n=1 Tax=Pelomonas parva TaxID=3299032 RepID=A0ABW7EXK1_9BURK